jgi:pyridoxal phosphate enzyme (YggS family)
MSEENIDIAENLKQVQANIDAACARAGRDTREVTLIAVSKTKPAEMIMEAYNAGKKIFGENKAQEMKEKYEELPKDIEWHFIGHLQTNKVKYVVGRAALIHSVDSVHLARAISEQSVKKNVVSKILIEVNAAGEESKFGSAPEDVSALVREIASLPNIKIEGLMTIAPFTDDPETNRKYFRKIKQLAIDIDRENIDNVSMNVLSMGMTGDYQVAVEEGATFVRVGTGIFGARNYNI